MYQLPIESLPHIPTVITQEGGNHVKNVSTQTSSVLQSIYSLSWFSFTTPIQHIIEKKQSEHYL